MWLPISVFTLLELGLLGVTAQTDIIPVSDPTVIIEQGTVQGSVSYHGNFEFYGIPYADATSGTNRFKAPNLPPTFANTFVANRKDVKCVRALGAGYEGTEDCLVANVFTPTLDNTTQLSVLVWVKGKEFDKMKDMDQSFENFVHKNIVVVSLNYRESVLGFLCLGTEVAPGNAGLKDIVAGLRWVRENIAQFGGNPDDITLIGHGSGAAAVDLITLSPMAYGLVNKAIVQSGSALSPWAVARDNLEYAIQVAEALGHRITNIDELSEIFERTSVAALMGVINELDLTDNSLAFAPCVERDNLTGIVPFISKTPYEIIQSGEFMQIPLIMGYVDNEGTIRSQKAVEDDWLVRMDQSFDEFLQPDLKFESQSQEAQIAERIRTRYFENDPIDMEHAENYIAYHGDTMILVSTIREVQMRVTATNSPIYLYQFSYKGILGESLMGPLAVKTAAHSEELAYMLFDSTNNQIQFRDMVVGDILIERWTNFAMTGNPTSESSNTVWSPFTSTQSSFLRFLDDEEISERSIFDLNLVDPHPTTMTFWDEIYTECFLDAESTWELTDRTDEEGSGEDSGEGSGEGSVEGSGEGSGEGSEGGIEDGSGEGSEEESGEGSEDGSGEGNGDGDNNSASTAVGYTFSIITIFAFLNKFHSSQTLS